jgi:ribonuclease G
LASEILINVRPIERRVALIENGALMELMIERDRNKGLVGSIYRGQVARVLPGMQAAFVDIGLDRAAFLYVGFYMSAMFAAMSDSRKKYFFSMRAKMTANSLKIKRLPARSLQPNSARPFRIS